MTRAVSSAKERGAQWLAALCDQPAPLHGTGGSDRTVDYYAAALLLLLSGAVALCTRTGPRRDAQLFGLLHFYFRIELACTMWLYGLAKLFPLQFVAPGPRILTMPVGDLTPTDLMWTFIGSSRPYTQFSGLAELAGALLLLSRRTTFPGASLLFLVMATDAKPSASFSAHVAFSRWPTGPGNTRYPAGKAAQSRRHGPAYSMHSRPLLCPGGAPCESKKS